MASETAAMRCWRSRLARYGLGRGFTQQPALTTTANMACRLAVRKRTKWLDASPSRICTQCYRVFAVRSSPKRKGSVATPKRALDDGHTAPEPHRQRRNPVSHGKAAVRPAMKAKRPCRTPQRPSPTTSGAPASPGSEALQPEASPGSAPSRRSSKAPWALGGSLRLTAGRAYTGATTSLWSAAPSRPAMGDRKTNPIRDTPMPLRLRFSCLLAGSVAGSCGER